MNILLASSGRRPYLVKWFQEALIANNLVGNVVAADLDPQAPIRSFADEFVQAPAVTESEYRSWLADTLREDLPAIYIAVSPHEHSKGHGRRSSRLLLQHMKENLNLPGAYAELYRDNGASYKLWERLSMYEVDADLLQDRVRMEIRWNETD